MNESDPRSNVHYLGSSENKSLRLYPQFKYMKKKKEHQKAVFFCKKENSALSGHTCLTNHTIG